MSSFERHISSFSILGLHLGGCQLLFDGKSGDGTEQQEETNEQVAGETSGAQSPALITGAGATVGGAMTSGVGGIGHQQGGVGNTDTTTIETSDPAVTLSALNANQNVTALALSTANESLADNESVATASIGAGVADTALNDQFGEDALNSAANVEASDTTALEAMSTETQQNAANALAAAQNETLAGVTPAQEFQAVQGEGSAGPGTIDGYSISTIATWLTVITGLIALLYFLKHKKPA